MKRTLLFLSILFLVKFLPAQDTTKAAHRNWQFGLSVSAPVYTDELVHFMLPVMVSVTYKNSQLVIGPKILITDSPGPLIKPSENTTAYRGAGMEFRQVLFQLKTGLFLYCFVNADYENARFDETYTYSSHTFPNYSVRYIHNTNVLSTAAGTGLQYQESKHFGAFLGFGYGVQWYGSYTAFPPVGGSKVHTPGNRLLTEQQLVGLLHAGIQFNFL